MTDRNNASLPGAPIESSPRGEQGSHEMNFRERVSYDVRGFPDSEAFPYVDGVPTLKEAIAIAKTYPGVYRDGAATHIVRRYSKEYPRGHEFHRYASSTHRWRVDANGRLQLTEAWDRGWGCTPTAMREYIRRLPRVRNKATSLRGQLVDLAQIADQIGLNDAYSALTAHVYGFRRLPDFCGFFKDQAEVTPQQIDRAAISRADTITWREVLELFMQPRPSGVRGQPRTPSPSATPAPSCAANGMRLLGSAIHQLRRILAKFTTRRTGRALPRKR